MLITYRPIGIVHSPFSDLESMPIQPASEASAPGVIEVFPEFAQALLDLGGFSHVIVLFHFHMVRQVKLTVIPYLDSKPHGIFATRAPVRPNPIGLSVVQLDLVEGRMLHVRDLDMLDGTPVLDLKPYVPEFDHQNKVRLGWLEEAKEGVRRAKSDDRFL